MYDYIIEEYIKKITKEDISNYARKKNIVASEEELGIIYQYIKEHWKVFYKGDPSSIFKELSTKINPYTFTKIKELYIEFKNKII